MHGRTRSDVHREVENSRSGLVLGAEDSGRTSNRGREIQLDDESERLKGTLSMPLTETPEIAFSGEVTTGSYSRPMPFTGTVTQSYTNAAICGVPQGRLGVTKPVKRGRSSGSAVTFK